MPKRALILLALLGASSLPALALEKCVSDSGKVSYSEQPCPPNSKGTTVRGTAPVAPARAPSATAGKSGGSRPGAANASQSSAPGKAPPSMKMGGGREALPIETRYFDVRGGDYDTLMAALKQNGLHTPGEWTLSYRYQIRRTGRACGAGALTTSLKQVIILPRWTPPPGTSPKLIADWTRYVGSVKRHQEGHLAIGRDMQEAFRDSVAVVNVSCERLEAELKSQFKVLLDRHRALEKTYDFETANGRTEGADFVQH